LDLSPQVTLSREASEQLVKNLSPQQQQAMLYVNPRDVERGKTLFINNTFNKIRGHFYYNPEFDALQVKVKPQTSDWRLLADQYGNSDKSGKMNTRLSPSIRGEIK